MQIPIESLNLQMLNVGIAHHNGDWNWKDVISPFTRIYLVTQGEAKLHLANETINLHQGHLYIIPAHTIHSYECKGVFVHYYLHIYEGYKNETAIFDRYIFPTEVEADDIAERLLRSMCNEHPDAQLPESDPRSYDNTATFTGYVKRYNSMELWQKMRLRSAILMLFSHFMKKARPRVWTQDERLSKVLEYINANIYNSINICTLADTACISTPYLIRLFRNNFGTSPLQYINKKKIEKAQLMLITEEETIKEVAYRLGFKDYSYFIRLFKKITGQTPLEFRCDI